jgi:hypothetical protein
VYDSPDENAGTLIDDPDAEAGNLTPASAFAW